MRKWLAELRQRNVFKVATAYTVAGWVLIQLGSELFGSFDAPLWVPKVFTILIFLGFPIACLFAWALEVTPEGVQPTQTDITPQARGSDWLWAGALLVTMLVAMANLAYNWQSRSPLDELVTTHESASVNPKQTPDTQPSVAVLPFENFSGNKSEDYFSEGLADTILHQLAQIPNLTVIARNSSFQFKGENLDVREVGSRLGVSNVLEGSVQRYGDQLRVIAQLVRTSDGSHAWSQSFDYTMADVFTLQDAIATAVAKQLKLTLLPKDASRIRLGGTNNLEAYDLLLQARAAFQQFTPTIADEVDADDYPPMLMLDKALALDPVYVDALVEKIEMYGMFAFMTTSNQRYTKYLDKAEPLVDKALKLAPEYSSVWNAKGHIAHRRGQHAESLAAYQKAVALNPNDAQAHQGLAIALIGTDPLSSLEHMRIKRQLDPEDRFNRPAVMALLQLDRIDEALAELESDLARTGNAGYQELILNDLAMIHYRNLGRPDQAAMSSGRLLALTPGNSIGRIGMGRAWMAVGDADRAGHWLNPGAGLPVESDYLKEEQMDLALVRGELDKAAKLLDSMVFKAGPAGNARKASIQFALCYLAGNLSCMRNSVSTIQQAWVATTDEPDIFPRNKARQQLMVAFVAAQQEESPEASAREVIAVTEGLPRASCCLDAKLYMDVEAYVLLDNYEVAVRTLEETLLPGGGILPLDTLGLPAERGFILSRMNGYPGFEDWKSRFLARREAMRERMVKLEAAGDIPAPPR